METVSRSRQYPVSVATLEEAMLSDVPGFLRAAGYDDVTVTDQGVVVERRLGMARLEMTLQVGEDAPETLAVAQVDGHFESMTTTYDVSPADGGALLTARTEFVLDDVVGAALEPELVRRRRGEEFEAQFDYLESVVGAAVSR
jgi:hypothetical protein